MLVVFYQLYIPQCIYFYTEFYLDEKDGERFTFHNVSISTRPWPIWSVRSPTFTFHNVSISTDAGYLITNMFMRFTFHNVSISTCVPPSAPLMPLSLHSTMYLFLHFWQNPRKYQIRLYIPQCIYFYPICRSRTKPRKCFTFHNVSISTGVLSHSVTNTSTFTFHNVSISTTERPQILPAQPPLHSTMYLFLPRTYLLMSCL